MEDALEAIHNRRSVRAYEDKAVPKDLIDKVIDAGLWAPSGMGRQSAIVVAVTDKEKISWLSELNRKIGGWKEGFDLSMGHQSCSWSSARRTCRPMSAMAPL